MKLPVLLFVFIIPGSVFGSAGESTLEALACRYIDYVTSTSRDFDYQELVHPENWEKIPDEQKVLFEWIPLFNVFSKEDFTLSYGERSRFSAASDYLVFPLVPTHVIEVGNIQDKGKDIVYAYFNEGRYYVVEPYYDHHVFSLIRSQFLRQLSKAKEVYSSLSNEDRLDVFDMVKASGDAPLEGVDYLMRRFDVGFEEACVLYNLAKKNQRD